MQYPELTKDNVLLFLVRIENISQSDKDTYLNILNCKETAEMARFRFQKDQDIFLISRALVRAILAYYSGVDVQTIKFAYNEFDKPSLVGNPSLHFNLSHTEGCIALVLCRSRSVGVDVECLSNKTRAVLDITEDCFSASEQAQLAELSDAEKLPRFTRLWTLKESYIKALGVGLSKNLGEFSFTFDDTGQIRFKDDKPYEDVCSAFSFYSFTLDDHLVSMAIQDELRKWSVYEVRPMYCCEKLDLDCTVVD